MDGIAGWDDNVEFEASAFVGRVGGAEEDGLPVEEVVFLDGFEQFEMRAGSGVLLDGHVLLQHPAVDSRRHCI